MGRPHTTTSEILFELDKTHSKVAKKDSAKKERLPNKIILGQLVRTLRHCATVCTESYIIRILGPSGLYI